MDLLFFPRSSPVNTRAKLQKERMYSHESNKTDNDSTYAGRSNGWSMGADGRSECGSQEETQAGGRGAGAACRFRR